MVKRHPTWRSLAAVAMLTALTFVMATGGSAATGETTRVSVSASGVQGNGSSESEPSISANGRYVAFTSSATNLVAGANGRNHIFVRNLQTSDIVLASVADDLTQGNGSSRSPSSPTDDGRLIAFTSSATNLVAGDTNLDACNELSLKVHGHHRGSELLEAIGQGTAAVAEHGGRITGYTTTIGFFGHAVGESNEDLKALIGAAPEFPGPGFLLPTRNGEVLRWCLERGLRVVQPMTLMSVGLYNEPRGAFMPLILY